MVYIQSQGSRMIKAEGSTESTMALPHWCSPSINTSLGYIGPDPTYFRVWIGMNRYESVWIYWDLPAKVFSKLAHSN